MFKIDLAKKTALAVALGCVLGATASAAVAGNAPAYRSGELIVKYKEGVVQANANGALKAHGVTEVRNFRRPRFMGSAPMDRWAHVKLGKGVTVEQAMARLQADPNVESVEPNYILRTSATPNDPRFDELWGMHNTGQTGGTADADIDAPEAWDTATGDGSVIVGVIDTGVAYTHPDLAANMWVNAGEVPGNNIDDDGNGFVDDVHGYDFINNDGDPFDDNAHGTHVAGTVAAVGDNGVGVAGVAWNAQIMGLKFLGADGSGSTTDAIDAILYGTDMGAKILNNSWGGGSFSASLQAAIQTANNAGVLFVAAAGNDAVDNDRFASYPANYDVPNVVAVSATDHNDNLASFSSFGATTVDLAAPGVSILSTTPYASENSLTVSGITYQGNLLDGGASASVSGFLADGGLCDTTGAWANQVVLCERGNISFADKVANAQNSGAAGAVIYNNEPGNFFGTLNGTALIPAISLSQEDGQFLVANELGANGDLTSLFDAQGLGYDKFDGTSMATPMVAGAAAVILMNDPTLNSDQLKQALMDSVDVIPGLAGTNVTGGRLNLANALAGGTPPGDNVAPVADAGPDQSVAPRAFVTLDGSASSDVDGTIASYSWAHVAGGRRTLVIRNPTTVNPRVRMPGVRVATDFVFELTVTDDDGATATDTVTVTVTP